QLRGATAHTLKAFEESCVARLDRLRDLAYGDREGAQRRLHADPFDGGEPVEKPLVAGANEANQPRLQVSPRGVTFEVKNGVECDGLTATDREFRHVGGGNEQLILQGAHLHADAILIDMMKLTGQR